jgi:hypothetical protein
MNPRLLRPTSSTLDSDAAIYLNAVAQADGQQLEPAVRKAINDFVVGCKRDGIWDAIQASCILAGARTLAGALTSLKGDGPTNVNNNFVSGDYDRETGLKAGGGKYLDANRNNNADPQDSNHHAVYVSEADSSGSASIYIDGGGNGTGANNIGRSGIVANLFLRNRCSTSGSVASGAATGLIGTNRNLSASYVVRASGTDTTITQASQTPADSAVFIFARPPSGTNNTDARLAFYSIGESLDLALLDTRVSALITAIGNAL